MKKVMGYPMKETNVDSITMPVGATILTIMEVYGTPTVFAAIDDDQKQEEVRTFHRVRTGMPFDEKIFKMRYAGSFMIQSFGYVFHVFEESFTKYADKVEPDIRNGVFVRSVPESLGGVILEKKQEAEV